MYPHRIRLRGPWDREPPGTDGRLRLRRRFGWPGRLDEHERAWLTLGAVGARPEVRLNGDLLNRPGDAAGALEFDVTGLLRVRNELVIDTELPAGDVGGWDVALEVRCRAYLRNVRAWLEPAEGGRQLHVGGDVVGTCERPLDLYVLRDGATVSYTTTGATPEGRAFHVIGADARPEGGPRLVRVELVDGATVWYAVEIDARDQAP